MATDEGRPAGRRPRSIRLPMITGRAGRRLRRSLLLLPLTLLALAARVDTGSAQVPARVAAPYTLMDDGDRLNLEFGAETPLRGNGPFTGYGYFFYTRPHFLDEDLYLRLVIPPGYLISELIRDHWPSRNSAVGVGISGGLWAESQGEFRDGRFEKEESFSGHSAGGPSPTTSVARRSAGSCHWRARSAQIPSTSGTTAPATRPGASACPRTPRSTTAARGSASAASRRSSSPGTL